MTPRQWVSSAFDNNTKGGGSARKLSAFWVICLITFLHVKYFTLECTEKDLWIFIWILVIDFLFVCVALGLCTFEQIIKLKNEKNNNTDPAAGGPAPGQLP